MDKFTLVATANDGDTYIKTGMAYYEAAELAKQYLAWPPWVEVAITKEGWHRDAATGKLSTADDPVILANSLD
jgi:hypothetical protein